MEALRNSGKKFTDPVELARNLDALAIKNQSEHSDTLNELNIMSEVLGLQKRYFVGSDRAFIISRCLLVDEEPKMEITDFSNGLAFSGDFLIFSNLEITGLADTSRENKENINAFCLTFHSLLPLSYLGSWNYDQLLYVPILGIDSIWPEK